MLVFCACPLHVSHLGQWVYRNVSVGCVHLCHKRCCDTNIHLHAEVLFAQKSKQHAATPVYSKLHINLKTCGYKMKLLNMSGYLVCSTQFYLSCCLNNILLVEASFFFFLKSCQFAQKVKQT